MHITIALTFGFIGLLAAIQSVAIQQQRKHVNPRAYVDPHTDFKKSYCYPNAKDATHYCVSYWPSDNYQDLTRQGDVSYDDIVCKKFFKTDIYGDSRQGVICAVPITRTDLALQQIAVDRASKEHRSRIHIKYDQPKHWSGINSNIPKMAPSDNELPNHLEGRANSLSRRAATTSGSSRYGLHFWNGDQSTYCMFTSVFLASGRVFSSSLKAHGYSEVPAEGIQCYYLAHLPGHQKPKLSKPRRKRGTLSTGRTSDIDSLQW